MNPKEVAKEFVGLLESKRNLTPGEYVPMDVESLQLICEEARNVLSKDKVLLKLSAPLNVIGDIHGQFTDLMKFIEIGGDPANTKYLFLGDYVDRGSNSVEVITILLCYKILYPDNVFLLRGNHETRDISELYGFLDEISSRYDNTSLWDLFNDVFAYLPLAAIINDRIFCVHGGLSQELDNVESINEVEKPLHNVPENGFIADLLWADPSPDYDGYKESERGTSFTFGKVAADHFLKANDFDLICRAHQVVDFGFDFPFYPLQTVLTVFSAPDYCGEYQNRGAMLKIDQSLMCSFDFVEHEKKGQPGRSRPLTPAATC